MSITEKDLFQRLVALETEKLTLTEDVNQLKKDAVYNEDTNPSGLSKEDIKLIHAASKLQAKNDYEERREAASAVFKKFEELTGYNS